MGRQPCCDKVGLRKGSWTAEEDKRLISFILSNGHCCWRALPKLAGLLRCGKSCRLRWTNYLRPDLKRGLLSEAEEQLIIDLHSKLGNRWSKIAAHLPGRTDNEIKNHWNTHIKKKLKKMGIDPSTHKPITTDIDDDGRKQQQQLLQGPPQHQLVGKDENKADHHHQIPPHCPAAIAAMAKKEETAVLLLADAREEKVVVTSPYDFTTAGSGNEMMMRMDAFLQQRSPAFCTDEVPMIQPGEIVVPSASSSSVSSTCSSTATSDASVLKPDEELRFPCMEWSESMLYSWGMDAFNGFDLTYDDDYYAR